jgi:leucyl-tRNA synthetase
MINDEKGEKMSKSKGNVVEPLKTMEKYGVDTTRYFLISVASPDKGFNWSEKGVQGSLRFINKIFGTFESVKVGKDSLEMAIRLNQAIKNISEQIENLQFRKSSIELRELFDMIAEEGEASKETLESSLKLLSPFCPHIAEEFWAGLGNDGFISIAEWPKVDKSMLKKDTPEEDLNSNIIVQVKPILEKIQDKNKVYLYVMPFEKEKVDVEVISEAIEKEVEVWATNEKDKHDPENKAKKARPGMPGIYLE